MEYILNLLSTIGIFIAAILILVFIHELGHFLTAKLFKMRVERFSLGMPPRLFGFQYGDTDYCLSATPLGGYVKISGMIDESMDVEHLNEEPKPYEFRSKPVWQRIIVITAGVIFNVFLAAFIYWMMFLSYGDVKVPLKNIEGFYVESESVPDRIGFKTGDKIVGINGQEVTYFQDILDPSQITKDELYFTVERGNELIQIDAPSNFLDELNTGKYFDLSHILPSKISNTVKGSPAEKAGILSGDEIIEVNGEPVSYWLELVSFIKNSEGSLVLTIQRGDERIDGIELIPDNVDKTIGIYPVDATYLEVERVSYGFFQALGHGVTKTGDMMTGIIQGFGKLLSGDISVRANLGGPVAIANFTKQATDNGGMRGFWEITAMLSITLAIMNILPIPVLDGGHLMFLIYEGITRREPSAKIRMVLQQVGFVLIIGLIIFVTFNDILRQFGI